jgi:hypothetical protein
MSSTSNASMGDRAAMTNSSDMSHDSSTAAPMNSAAMSGPQADTMTSGTPTQMSDTAMGDMSAPKSAAMPATMAGSMPAK